MFSTTPAIIFSFMFPVNLIAGKSCQKKTSLIRKSMSRESPVSQIRSRKDYFVLVIGYISHWARSTLASPKSNKCSCSCGCPLIIILLWILVWLAQYAIFSYLALCSGTAIWIFFLTLLMVQNTNNKFNSCVLCTLNSRKYICVENVASSCVCRVSLDLLYWSQIYC